MQCEPWLAVSSGCLSRHVDSPGTASQSKPFLRVRGLYHRNRERNGETDSALCGSGAKPGAVVSDIAGATNRIFTDTYSLKGPSDLAAVSWVSHVPTWYQMRARKIPAVEGNRYVNSGRKQVCEVIHADAGES